MIWIMLLRGREKWCYIKAEAPCWKGEILIPVCKQHYIVIGWQK